MEENLPSHQTIGKLLFNGDLLRYLSLVVGIALITFLGQRINLFSFFDFIKSFEAVIAFFYGVLVVPAFSYFTFRWFFLRIQVILNASSETSLTQPGKGTLTLKKGFSNFLVAYFLSFGVLLVTLGIGFPYYLYEQKAWFFRESLITFPDGRAVQVKLTSNFKSYFFKSWGILLFFMMLLVVFPVVALFFLIGNAIFSGLGFILGTIGIFLLITNYYFYWSIKWMVSHTQLIFLEPGPISTKSPMPKTQNQESEKSQKIQTKRLFFKNDFFNFMVGSVPFIILGVVTFGVGLIGYVYWMGRWFINNTEIQNAKI